MKRITDCSQIKKARDKRLARRIKRGWKPDGKHAGLIIDNGKVGKYVNDFELHIKVCKQKQEKRK